MNAMTTLLETLDNSFGYAQLLEVMDDGTYNE